ncbi:invasion associated locus B family protein [Aureimonas fodinaquatilis]|uniref:Invasion associated locus B family protein n=1 Tax=Aureimonas fodinaquatilis TaxID=2565783 RepID=A0A5B0DPV6_9HYPH|nr:invasion associated locus B family protein [Aureimonas fodinaquatilis]KAA0968516.1 invasion associated locus B family protein [Aureimonas fodinaquatilis]
MGFATKLARFAIPAALCAFPHTPALAQNATTGLPNGATSINETYDEWIVTCLNGPNGKACSLAQIQNDQKSGQRALAIQLQSSAETATGVLLLPFGLQLSEGVTMAIDEATPLEKGAFSTCLPQGCMVPLNFDAEKLAALKTGKLLQLAARPMGAAEDAKLQISLKGFNAALNRVQELSK